MPANSATETSVYSRAQYDLHVYVAEKTPPITGNPFYVWAIGAYRVLTDEGTSAPGNEKVNPWPGGVQSDLEGYKYSKMIFNNSYLRSGGGGTLPTDARFRVNKTVTGLGSSSALYFNFDVTIQKPAISTKTTYRVYVFEGTSTNPLNATQLQANVLNPTLINNGGYIDYPLTPPGTIVRFKLKHNQYLSFSNIDDGATYVVNEIGTQFYTPSYVLTKGGVSTAPVPGTLNNGHSTPTVPPTTITISPTNNYIDSAAFTNAREPITPTGIAVNDMPYLAMVVVALASLSGYMFFRIKVRKNKDEVVDQNA
jgi:hypothetical protein